MDWNAAIERHREALKRVLAALMGMAGLWDSHPSLACRPSPPQGGRIGGIALPRYLHRAVLRLLRPAESAARRLVIVAARELPSISSPLWGEVSSDSETERGSASKPKAKRDAQRPHSIALPLFDPLRRTHFRQASTAFPRISIPGWSEPAPLPIPPAPDDEIDATRLTLRLAALARALNDLPCEARRFARWQASRDAAGAQIKETRDAAGAQNREMAAPDSQLAAGAANRDSRKTVRFRRLSPLRGGQPPGQRSARRPAHEIHQILDDVHGLAFWVLETPDTS